MGLLGSDDMVAYVEDSDSELRWYEMKVRILAPTSARTDRLIQESVHLDPLMISQIGKPVECPNECGRAAVARTGFPHGDPRDGAIYCPHCDGAEDVG